MKCEAPTTLKDWIETFTSVCTVIGVIVTVALFVHYNETAPRLNITQDVRLMMVASGLKVVSLDLHLENAGKSTVQGGGGHILVRRILPLDPAQIARAEATADPYLEGPFGQFHTDDLPGEIVWPEIIAPIPIHSTHLKSGEKETRHYEFSVPQNVTLLQTDVNLPGGSEPLVWRAVKNTALTETPPPAAENG